MFMFVRHDCDWNGVEIEQTNISDRVRGGGGPVKEEIWYLKQTSPY